MKSMPLVLVLAALASKVVECLDKEMTIVVSAKDKQCFYERVPENFIIDIEYQVRLTALHGLHASFRIFYQVLSRNKP